MLWSLEIVRGDGTAENLTAPLPASWYCEQWPLILDVLGKYGRSSIRLVAEDGFTLTPIAGDDVVEWWKVEPGSVVKPDLKTALSYCQARTR